MNDSRFRISLRQQAEQLLNYSCTYAPYSIYYFVQRYVKNTKRPNFGVDFFDMFF